MGQKRQTSKAYSWAAKTGSVLGQRAWDQALEGQVGEGRLALPTKLARMLTAAVLENTC
jgi:hypothetical protein